MSWLKNLLTEEVPKEKKKEDTAADPLLGENPVDPLLDLDQDLPSLVEGVPVAQAPVTQAPSKTPLGLTIEEAYVMGKAASGKNSATTIIQMMEGLKAFPPDQQLAMIRVLDVQDDGWDEMTVKQDAALRIKILDKFSGLVDKDVVTQSGQFSSDFEVTQTDNLTQILSTEEEIKKLQEFRDLLRADTAAAEQHRDESIASLCGMGEAKKEEIQAVKQSLLDFLRFFGESV